MCVGERKAGNYRRAKSAPFPQTRSVLVQHIDYVTRMRSFSQHRQRGETVVTITDVAKHGAASPATVSWMAIGLMATPPPDRNARGHTPEPQPRNRRLDAFAPHVARGVAQEAQERGYAVTLGPTTRSRSAFIAGYLRTRALTDRLSSYSSRGHQRQVRFRPWLSTTNRQPATQRATY